MHSQTLVTVAIIGAAQAAANTARAASQVVFIWVPSDIGALARLQLGRASTLSGDKIKAKTAYEDFLTLWKDADNGIPILKQAKAEFAKLE